MVCLFARYTVCLYCNIAHMIWVKMYIIDEDDCRYGKVLCFVYSFSIKISDVNERWNKDLCGVDKSFRRKLNTLQYLYLL